MTDVPLYRTTSDSLAVLGCAAPRRLHRSSRPRLDATRTAFSSAFLRIVDLITFPSN